MVRPGNVLPNQRVNKIYKLKRIDQMKDIIKFLGIIIFTGPAFSQIIIGGETGAAGTNTQSVLMDFSLNLTPDEGRGIILPYVVNKDNINTEGTVFLDASNNKDARVLYKNGNNSWFDLSNSEANGGNVTAELATQPGINEVNELGATGAVIGEDVENAPSDGVLILNSSDKAMVLPQVNTVNDVINPSPGMMVYVRGKKLLAVYNGNHWAFWRAE